MSKKIYVNTVALVQQSDRLQPFCHKDFILLTISQNTPQLLGKYKKFFAISCLCSARFKARTLTPTQLHEIQPRLGSDVFSKSKHFKINRANKKKKNPNRQKQQQLQARGRKCELEMRCRKEKKKIKETEKDKSISHLHKNHRKQRLENKTA